MLAIHAAAWWKPPARPVLVQPCALFLCGAQPSSPYAVGLIQHDWRFLGRYRSDHATAYRSEPGEEMVPLKVVTAVLSPLMDTLFVPLPVAPLNLPVPAMTAQESKAVPCGVPTPHDWPGPCSVIWSPLAAVRVASHVSVWQPGAG